MLAAKCIFRANNSVLLSGAKPFIFLLSTEKKVAARCTCWHPSHMPLTWQYAKPCFSPPPPFFVFFFREQISMVTGLISTAWALEIPLFLKSSGGSKGIKPFPFSSPMHANTQSVSTEVVEALREGFALNYFLSVERSGG